MTGAAARSRLEPRVAPGQVATEAASGAGAKGAAVGAAAATDGAVKVVGGPAEGLAKVVGLARAAGWAVARLCVFKEGPRGSTAR